ncbi:MAG: hypothetical protein ACQEP1_03395 [Nanobdellota archaeon]
MDNKRKDDKWAKIEEKMPESGFLNKGVIYLTYFPEAENSENPGRRFAAKHATRPLRDYFAGNMTTKEQEEYSEMTGTKPLWTTLYNFSVHTAFFFGTAALSENEALDITAISYWGIANLHKLRTLKTKKGYPTLGIESIAQNSTTYIKKAGRWMYNKSEEHMEKINEAKIKGITYLAESAKTQGIEAYTGKDSFDKTFIGDGSTTSHGHKNAEPKLY